MDVGFRPRVMDVEGELANKIEAWLGFDRSAQRTGSIISIGSVIESCRFSWAEDVTEGRVIADVARPGYPRM